GASTADRAPQVSPAARAVAAEHAIDIASVRGTGPNDRVTKDDVLRAVEERKEAPASKPVEAPDTKPAQPPSPPSTTPEPAVAAAPPAPSSQGGRETRSRMSRRRKTIAT